MRDIKGRFKKSDDEGIKINFTIPSIKKIIYLMLLFTILLPWIIIGFRFNILKNIFELIEALITKQVKQKKYQKNGLFY